MAAQASGVRRRDPLAARTEILDAGRRQLADDPARLSVAAVMARTNLARKTFYVHFADLGALVRELVRPLREELDGAMGNWTADDTIESAGAAALERAADLYSRNSDLLRALWWSTPGPDGVETREALLEPLVATGARLLAARRGTTADQERPVAHALASMNISELLLLGPSPTPHARASVLDALRQVWTSVLGVR